MSVQTTAVRGRGIGEAARILAVAVQFLTRIPVPAIPVHDDDLRRATAAFPLVGVVVGGLAAGTFVAVGWALGGFVAAVAAVTVAVAVTGAFHEDGLADTFDGLWGGWDPEQRLRIMRDSRLGTYGACALALSLALRVGLLAPLPPATAVRALLVGHVVGRASVLVQIRLLPPVRDQGSGAKVAQPVGWLGLTVATATTLGVSIAALGGTAWAPLAAALVGILALRRAARRRLGGLTGDILGATQQVALILAMAAVVVLGQDLGW